MGAFTPVTAAERADLEWWAFQQVQIPEVQSDQASNAVDAFIRESLAKHGMSPAADADSVTLIKRLHYDLTGLPPGHQEIEAFIRSTSEDSYETLVDRLLESQHFGERWARHWLDVVRFAETNGYERDEVKPNI